MAKNKNKVLRIVLIVLGVVLIGAVGSAIWLVNYVANPQNAFSELEESQPVKLAETPAPTETTAAAETVEAEATPTPTESESPEMTQPDYEFEKKRVNILLLGADSSTERISAGMNFRTDTMILVTVDFENKDVDMISIPRDSYMRINKGTKFNKINAAFTYGGGADKDGYAYAMNTVSDLLGVKVDYYVGFGMNVVKDVVNAMGGVDYDVDIAFTLCGRETKKGLQHMDGQQVLDYCRWRKGGRGDVDRVERQQKMLFKIFETMLATDQVKNIPDIYAAVQENIDTNLTTLQIATLAYFAKDLTMEQIDRHTIPGEGQYVGSKSYYIINQTEKNEMVKEIFGIEGPYDEDITLEAIQARVLGEESTEEEGEESTGEESNDTLAEAQEMVTYIEEYADLENDEVKSAYQSLKSAVSSGSASDMKEAMSAVRALLPDA